MLTLLQDIRYSLRQLIKSPALTLTAVISLALGIGATTAVFSVVYAILMNPYPYAASDRMVHMRLKDRAGHDIGFGLTGAQWQQIRTSPVVEDAVITDDWNLTVTGHDLPEDVSGVYMTSNGFNYFGVPALLGRGLVPADAVDGQVHSLSWCWASSSGKDTSIRIRPSWGRLCNWYRRSSPSWEWQRRASRGTTVMPTCP